MTTGRNVRLAMLVFLCLFVGYSRPTTADAVVGPYEVIAYEHAEFMAITKSWRLAAGMRQRLVDDVGDELDNMLASIRIGEEVGVALFDEPHFGGKWQTYEVSTHRLRSPMLNRTSSLIIYPKRAGGPSGIELVGIWQRQFFPLPEIAEETVALYPQVGDIMDDRAESVRIYGEVETVLFEQADFTGKQITLPESERVDADIYLGRYQMERSVSALRLAWTGPPPTRIDPVPSIADPVSGVGTAAIDGVMHPREWDHAGAIRFDAILPPDYRYAADTVPATLYVMNDAHHMYLGVCIEQAGFSGGEITVYFDNDNDGIKEAGDDVLRLSLSGAFVDATHHTVCEVSPAPSLCVEADTALGTTRDGAGTCSDNGVVTFFELSRPLNGTDVNDVSVGAGGSVGVAVTLWLSVGIEPTLSIAAEARAVPAVGYYPIRIIKTG